MNTLRQLHTDKNDMLSMPIETGLRNSKKLINVMNHNIHMVHLDMSSMVKINAKELGKLLRLYRTLNGLGKQVKLINVSLRVMLFLELTQADSLFDISLNQDQYTGFAA